MIIAAICLMAMINPTTETALVYMALPAVLLGFFGHSKMW